MLVFVMMMAAAVASPILHDEKSASQALRKFLQLSKVNQNALLELLLPAINRNIEREKRYEDLSGLPLALPSRLQPPPYIFVLPATTPGFHGVYAPQYETDRSRTALTTAVLPDAACKICPEQMDRHDKMLASGVVMSCCGAMIEPADPFQNEKKEHTKRVEFGNVYSIKWEKKRQSNGKTSGLLDLPKLKIFLLGSKAAEGPPHKLLMYRIKKR